ERHKRRTGGEQEGNRRGTGIQWFRLRSTTGFRQRSTTGSLPERSRRQSSGEVGEFQEQVILPF
ncbi:MAG: hypothetical protein LWX70_12135, partial [Sphingobacteriia bacterium]|nr:hypothetical protein [Sphingobacteriia bacterium]